MARPTFRVGLKTDAKQTARAQLRGLWDLATAHPDRCPAIAPMCGGTNPALAPRLAERQLPVWIMQGGRDHRVKPQWICTMANALEQAGHRSVRLTVHEDLGHNCWTRATAGEDLYCWFLAHRRPKEV